jgi:hypothetical protein
MELKCVARLGDFNTLLKSRWLQFRVLANIREVILLSEEYGFQPVGREPLWSPEVQHWHHSMCSFKTVKYSVP